MTLLKTRSLLLCLALPTALAAQNVHDTGEDIYASDGPWMAVPADFNPGPMTAADIIAMADLDGDPLTITPQERQMIAMLTQVLIPAPNSP